MTEIATQQDVDAQPGFPTGLQGVRRPESCRAANRHEPVRSFAAGGWAARALGSGKACALVRHAPLTECWHCAGLELPPDFLIKLLHDLAKACPEIRSVRNMACTCQFLAERARTITSKKRIWLAARPNLPPLLVGHIQIFLPWVRAMLAVHSNRCVLENLDPRAPANVIIPDADTIHKYTLAEVKEMLVECENELDRTNPLVAEIINARKRLAPAER